MTISDLAVRKAKATGKEYTLADHDGLALCVTAQGGKSWHFRYYWLGKQKRISLGTYPEVTLGQARELRDEARKLLAKGINPRADRKKKREVIRLAGKNTFQAVYEQWLAHRALTLEEGRQTTLGQIPRIFKKDVLPILRGLTIYEVTRAHLLDVVGRIEARGSLSVAEKVRTWLRQLFEYAAVVIPELEASPATGLQVVAAPLPPVQHNPHLRLSELPTFLRTLRNYPGQLQTQLGLRFLLLTGVRTGELRRATPDQFDLDRGLWIIPAVAVKQLKLRLRKKRQRSEDIPHYIVPLSAQAMEIVRYMLEEFKSAQRYLFASVKNLKQCISENTLNNALKRIGYEELLTGHGIRGTISTALNEFGYPKVWIDAQLSHADPDKVSGAYNHAEYVEQRRVMMQDWADRLDLLEQDQLDAASLRLTIHIEGVPAVGGLQAAPVRAQTTNSPVLVVTRPGNSMPTLPATVNRLSAVSLPPYAQREASQIHLERMKLIEEFESPHNLRVVEFAKLAGRSRRWISYEIRARNVLALSMGKRGLRVPDWHLNPIKHSLIQSVLKEARNTDSWRLYHVLSRPHGDLGGRAPIEAVTASTLRKVTGTVLRTLNAAEDQCGASPEQDKSSEWSERVARPSGAPTATNIVHDPRCHHQAS